MAEVRPAYTALSVPLPSLDVLVRSSVQHFEPNSVMARTPVELSAAHVTVLAPFVKPDDVNERILDQLRRICTRHAPHTFSVERVSAFAGGCVYMPPEPDDPLRALMRDVWQQWPDYPPYEGIFGDIVPHVTLAIVEDRPEAIAEVTAFAEPFLPLSTEARELTLVAIRDGMVEPLHTFALGR